MLVHLQVEGGHCKIIDLVGLRLAVDGPSYDPQFGPALAGSNSAKDSLGSGKNTINK